MNTLGLAVRRLGALVLDDNPFYRSMAAETLRTLGFARLELMASLDAALGLFKVYTPDIVLCDWRPDGFDGIAFTKAVRKGALPIKRSTGIVLVTAQSTSDAVETARNAGVDEYVIKPYTANTLLARIEAVVNRRRPFVSSTVYSGPCRRRRLEVDYGGPPRRLFDHEAEGEDTAEVKLRKQLAEKRLSSAKTITRELGPGDRQKIREIFYIGQECLEIANAMNDPLLRTAADSMVAYIRGTGASSHFDPEVIDAHIDAMQQLVSVPNCNAEIRRKVSGALSKMVAKKLRTA